LKIDRQKIMSRGFTLAEMLVAVSITVIMLLIVGLVFSSSIKATGIGASSNDVMGQLRTVPGQLEKDFTGWRRDMPMAIIFEGISGKINIDWGDPTDSEKYVHYDRICGFANGDFQDLQGTASGNVARIFYGQMYGALFDPISYVAPPRRILSRRYKILTAYDPERYTNSSFSSIPLNLLNWPIVINPESYDGHLFEEASVQLWRNRPFTNYEDYFFRTDFLDIDSIPSFVRAPNYDMVSMDDLWLQQLYLLPDVTDFRIQIWVQEEIAGSIPIQYKGRWFPTDVDMGNFWNYSGKPSGNKFAIYWNTPQLSGSPWFIDGIPWFSPLNCQSYYFNDTGLNLLVGDIPAVKFTFTLYDKGRKNFPQGQTFEYIVKLGQ